MTYRELDATHIIGTLERLCHRIEERFPGAGLAGVGRELVDLARDSASEAESLGTPIWPVRIAVGVVLGLMVIVVAVAVTSALQLLRVSADAVRFTELVQGTESAINEVVFLGIATFFLLTVEGRIKRRIAHKRIHQLRSVAHIVDMHQLTKDPDRFIPGQADTASSPDRQLSRLELGRYLDYCSEMLSLTGKIAALFVQRFDDSIVRQAVNEIEDLTNGISRKIWQKITILDRLAESGEEKREERSGKREEGSVAGLAGSGARHAERDEH